MIPPRGLFSSYLYDRLLIHTLIKHPRLQLVSVIGRLVAYMYAYVQPISALCEVFHEYVTQRPGVPEDNEKNLEAVELNEPSVWPVQRLNGEKKI